MREAFVTDSGPEPRGPYSAAVRVGNQVHVSGQLGLSPDGELADSFAEQVHLAMRNLLGALAAAGAAQTDVVKVNIYLVRREDSAAMNEIYREYFTAPFPARTTIVAGLSSGVLFEVDAQAALAGFAESQVPA